MQISGSNFSAPLISNWKVWFKDDAGLAILIVGTGALPTDIDTYEKGCIALKTDTAGGSVAVYTNTGTVALPNFVVLT